MEQSEVRTMSLPVELTTEEVNLRAREAAALIRENADQDRRMDALTSAYEGGKTDLEEEMEDTKSKLRHLAEVVRNGREDRDVEVYDEIDGKGQKVDTIRSDTKAIVSTRGLTESERQRSLFKEAKKAAGAEGVTIEKPAAHQSRKRGPQGTVPPAVSGDQGLVEAVVEAGAGVPAGEPPFDYTEPEPAPLIVGGGTRPTMGTRAEE